ncbi:MAG: hypothetical protein V4773_27395 [Verrucomicrobiota bacterium]
MLGGSALTAPYASYLHTLPRFVAALATWADPRWAPAIFAAIAFLFTLYCAALTQSARCPLPRHPAFALAVVLVPDASEVLLNITNLQWINFASFVLILISADGRRWWQQVHDCLLAALIGLSGPFSILIAPLFIWRALQRRTWASSVLCAVVVIAAGIQAWTVLRNPTVAQATPIALVGLLAVPGMRIAGSLLWGYFVPDDFPRWIEVILGIASLALVAALALRKGPLRTERIGLAFAFAGLLASSLYRCRYVLPDLCHASFGSRYFFPLQLFALWLILVAAADPRRSVARLCAGLIIWIGLINLPRLKEPAYVDLHWEDYAQRIRRGMPGTIPVNPQPWKIVLPARDVPWTDEAPPDESQRHKVPLRNVATRATIRPDEPMHVGFLVGGTSPHSILLRVVGPSLTHFGVTDPLQRPVLQVRSEKGESLETKDAKGGASRAAKAAQVVGAFPLPKETADVAIVLDLEPGLYSAMIAGEKPSDAGQVLFEVYVVD